MTRYRKKEIINAIQFTDEEPETLIKLQEFLDVEELRVSYVYPNKQRIIIESLEKDIIAHVGDYIVKRANGDFFALKPCVFEKTYEPIETEDIVLAINRVPESANDGTVSICLDGKQVI